VDREAFTRLVELLGSKADTMVPVLLSRFLLDAVRLQEEARAALVQGRAKDLQRAVHTLKSNARNFGALALGDACQELETAVRSGIPEQAEAMLARIASEVARASPELEGIRSAWPRTTRAG